MLDSTTPLTSIPAARKPGRIAVYFNGLFAISPADLAALQRKFPQARIYLIDVLGTAPLDCSILDVETGDAAPGRYPRWAAERLGAHEGALCRPYCNLSTWPDLKANTRQATRLVQERTRYWIANPTNPPKPHLVPGSSATQFEWGQLDPQIGNLDVSEVDPSWDH